MAGKADATSLGDWAASSGCRGNVLRKPLASAATSIASFKPVSAPRRTNTTRRFRAHLDVDSLHYMERARWPRKKKEKKTRLLPSRFQTSIRIWVLVLELALVMVIVKESQRGMGTVASFFQAPFSAHAHPSLPQHKNPCTQEKDHQTSKKGLYANHHVRTQKVQYNNSTRCATDGHDETLTFCTPVHQNHGASSIPTATADGF